MVAANAATDQTQLFEVAAARDRLRAEIGEHPMQIAVQGGGEVCPETTAPIAAAAETKPVLAYFGEPKPMVEQPLADGGVCRYVAEEFDVPNDALMQVVVALLLAVEQQERVDEQWQIVDQREVECAIGFQRHRRDLEEVCEVDATLGIGHKC